MAGLTRKDYEEIGRAMVPLLKQELAPIEARLAELESRSLKYFGVWQASQAYPPGAVVTCDGALHATGKMTVAERPMTAHSPWQLIVKAGK